MPSCESNLSIGLLPETKNRWSSFGTGLVIQAIGVVLLTQLGLIHPQTLIQNKKYNLVSLVSAPLESYARKPHVRATAPRIQAVAPLVEAKLKTPRMVAPEVKAEVRTVQPELARVLPKQNLAPQAEKTRKPDVQTGVFASNAAPAVNRPAREVQTGGFGDPNGVRGEGRPNQRATVASLGAFEMPRGGGYGNGRGGASGVRGTVVETSFSSSGTASSGYRSRGLIQQGGFGDARPIDEPKRAPKAAAVNSIPVEILSKPNPAYTNEARQLRIEGEVVLQVRFGANGELQVVRVMQGLGHGLDESAVQAARKIKFKPAKQDGAVVDSIAALHVSFQLAY